MRVAVVLLVVGVGVLARGQDAEVVTPARVPLSDVSTLASFHRAYHASKRGEHRLRVVFHGASHTANDQYTSIVRQGLQSRLGDGGPGWVMPAPPFPLQSHAGVAVRGTGWTGHKVRGREQRRDEYGYAGFFLQGQDTHATLRSRSPIDVAELFAAGEGEVDLLVDGVVAQTAALRSEGARLVAEFAEGTPAIGVRVRGTARIYGVALERRGASGAVVDALGVPGTRIWDQERWQTRLMATQLGTRPPDLVALAYGTNESANQRVPIAEVRERIRRVVRRWKRLAPEASIALVGPGEWPRRRANGTYGPRSRLVEVVEAQRRVAAEEGVAFFDTLAWMGGEGAMVRWVGAGLALDDHVHFTQAGYDRFGQALLRAMLP